MKTSYRVTETAPIGHNMNPRRTSQTQATAAADAIEQAIATNPHVAKTGKRLWVNTGHLKRSISTEVSGETVVVVAPSGYFEDSDLYDRLVETVPVVANPFLDPDVERAFQKSVDEAIQLEPKGRR